jgi:hypothetical protein
LGIDFDSQKCKLANKFGADTVDLSKGEDPLLVAKYFSRERGVDGVLITAASQSDEIMHQSAEMCRKRGRIVLVGVVGLNLRRDDFFKKEITFQVSSSYGPGRYDPFYEEKGNDYPVGFVRWTEQRNFEAVLDMMSSGQLDVKSLITHRYNIDNAIEAYSILDSPSTLGIIISYPQQSKKTLTTSRINLRNKEDSLYDSELPQVGCLRAGNYASRTLIPLFKKEGAILVTNVSRIAPSFLNNGINVLEA